MAPLMLLAIYLLVICLLYLSYLIYYQYNYWKQRKILHAELIPIFGNIVPILFGRPLATHMQNLYKKFPGARYYGIFDLTKPMVLIKDPELIREIGIKNFEHFTDHLGFVTEEMDPIVGRNVFSLKGQRWKDVRSTLSPSFTAARMKILFQLIAECSEEFVQYFLEHPEAAKSFDAKDVIARYTTDVIATAAFGVKVNSLVDKDNEFYRHGTNSMKFNPLRFFKIMLMRFFPQLMRLMGATFLPKSDDRFFKKLIKETVRLRKEQGIVRPDMIHLLMQAMDKDDGVNVTIDDVIAQGFIFFLAGFDTTSSLICFTAHELAANPDVQDKLYQEIEKLYKEKDGNITYESLTEMKYLNMVVSESLRKYPPGPVTNRVCVKSYKFPPQMEGFPEYVMEKDTLIMIPIIGLHRDPKYFSEPDKFIPERFSEENKDKINPCAYIPFGLGPRTCIANRFALMEAKILIVHVLRKFVIKFTEKTKHPIEFGQTAFTLSSKDGFWLRFEERKKVD